MCMKIDEFILKFSDAIEYDKQEKLTPEIVFRELEIWDSLAAMSLIGLIDQEFRLIIRTDEMKSAHTLKELYDLIQSKIING
jgi:acyl carrier protein